uniref:Uncharacterized protein n=1 Tax=Anguilla anguilla TaxID=7936 RepID=A0A0E9SID6_ANGAN
MNLANVLITHRQTVYPVKR